MAWSGSQIFSINNKYHFTDMGHASTTSLGSFLAIALGKCCNMEYMAEKKVTCPFPCTRNGLNLKPD